MDEYWGKWVFYGIYGYFVLLLRLMVWKKIEKKSLGTFRYGSVSKIQSFSSA